MPPGRLGSLEDRGKNQNNENSYLKPKITKNFYSTSRQSHTLKSNRFYRGENDVNPKGNPTTPTPSGQPKLFVLNKSSASATYRASDDPVFHQLPAQGPRTFSPKNGTSKQQNENALSSLEPTMVLQRPSTIRKSLEMEVNSELKNGLSQLISQNRTASLSQSQVESQDSETTNNNSPDVNFMPSSPINQIKLMKVQKKSLLDDALAELNEYSSPDFAFDPTISLMPTTKPDVHDELKKFNVAELLDSNLRLIASEVTNIIQTSRLHYFKVVGFLSASEQESETNVMNFLNSIRYPRELVHAIPHLPGGGNASTSAFTIKVYHEKSLFSDYILLDAGALFSSSSILAFIKQQRSNEKNSREFSLALERDEFKIEKIREEYEYYCFKMTFILFSLAHTVVVSSDGVNDMFTSTLRKFLVSMSNEYNVAVDVGNSLNGLSTYLEKSFKSLSPLLKGNPQLCNHIEKVIAGFKQNADAIKGAHCANLFILSSNQFDDKNYHAKLDEFFDLFMPSATAEVFQLKKQFSYRPKIGFGLMPLPFVEMKDSFFNHELLQQYLDAFNAADQSIQNIVGKNLLSQKLTMEHFRPTSSQWFTLLQKAWKNFDASKTATIMKDMLLVRKSESNHT